MRKMATLRIADVVAAQNLPQRCANRRRCANPGIRNSSAAVSDGIADPAMPSLTPGLRIDNIRFYASSASGLRIAVSDAIAAIRFGHRRAAMPSLIGPSDSDDAIPLRPCGDAQTKALVCASLDPCLRIAAPAMRKPVGLSSDRISDGIAAIREAQTTIPSMRKPPSMPSRR
jgi:hypothetical protein